MVLFHWNSTKQLFFMITILFFNWLWFRMIKPQYFREKRLIFSNPENRIFSVCIYFKVIYSLKDFDALCKKSISSQKLAFFWKLRKFICEKWEFNNTYTEISKIFFIDGHFENIGILAQALILKFWLFSALKRFFELSFTTWKVVLQKYLSYKRLWFLVTVRK